MAGNDDGNGIDVVGLAYGAKRPRAADLFSNFSIGAGFAIRNAQQSMPAFLLKVRSFEVKFAGKLSQLTTEIRLKFCFIRLQLLWRFDPHFPLSGFGERAAKIDVFQASLRSSEHKFSHLRLHAGVEQSKRDRHQKNSSRRLPSGLKNSARKGVQLTTPLREFSSIPTLLLPRIQRRLFPLRSRASSFIEEQDASKKICFLVVSCWWIGLPEAALEPAGPHDSLLRASSKFCPDP